MENIFEMNDLRQIYYFLGMELSQVFNWHFHFSKEIFSRINEEVFLDGLQSYQHSNSLGIEVKGK